MPYKTETSSENFRKRVDGVVRSGKSIRANIQDLALFAIVAYLDPKNNGNLNDLTYLIAQVCGVKSLAGNRLIMWTEDTINVKVGKTQDGEPVCRKATKGEDPALRENADLNAPWWEHGRAPVNKPVDILAEIDKLVKRIESTQGEEAKKELAAGQDCMVPGVLNDLSGLKARAERAQRDAELAEHDNVEDMAA